ncbi:hypothetical protein VP01_1004g5 [Puccinia sorghi]|uniref:Uncharacterized protein n=1 Tax=Puccinia sorghi TaxID=27349 RepID=A0A0L6VVN4_9BASI|nr:hypothetical protein VP01_1004g5 [Puccinia sorghi]
MFFLSHCKAMNFGQFKFFPPQLQHFKTQLFKIYFRLNVINFFLDFFHCSFSKDSIKEKKIKMAQIHCFSIRKKSIQKGKCSTKNIQIMLFWIDEIFHCILHTKRFRKIEYYHQMMPNRPWSLVFGFFCFGVLKSCVLFFIISPPIFSSFILIIQSPSQPYFNHVFSTSFSALGSDPVRQPHLTASTILNPLEPDAHFLNRNTLITTCLPSKKCSNFLASISNKDRIIDPPAASRGFWEDALRKDHQSDSTTESWARCFLPKKPELQTRHKDLWEQILQRNLLFSPRWSHLSYHVKKHNDMIPLSLITVSLELQNPKHIPHHLVPLAMNLDVVKTSYILLAYIYPPASSILCAKYLFSINVHPKSPTLLRTFSYFFVFSHHSYFYFISSLWSL